MMMTLFNEERIIQNYVVSERREAAEEAAAETAKEAVKKMLRAGKMSLEEIADCFTALSLEEVQDIEKEMLPF